MFRVSISDRNRGKNFYHENSKLKNTFKGWQNFQTFKRLHLHCMNLRH